MCLKLMFYHFKYFIISLHNFDTNVNQVGGNRGLNSKTFYFSGTRSYKNLRVCNVDTCGMSV